MSTPTQPHVAPEVHIPPVEAWRQDSPIGVPEGLAALSDAAAAEELSVQRRFLNLHEVPQISFEDARPAFPALANSFPQEWKQQVRQLRARLSQMQADVSRRQEHSLQVVSICSLDAERPRHGLAANLAYMLATVQENRVLVVDGRVGQPGLGEALGMPLTQGLCEATRLKREDLPNCMRRISGSQLYLMPTGQADTFGFDPIDLRGLHVLLHGLRTQFDWIVIDSPSFDNPADAMLMSQCADGTLFVVEREKDNFAALSKALGETQGRYLLGAVLV
jgi:Mrp family chromosome partitioning ATPase